ncbi:hypothetical protein E2C01_061791 [Portunus trituberculatus]|uniref:Uncharacterized protein n=1 Tax=Portunus trituberculatus TaxID=210409 RepID=A0A5B7HGA8_PORTR|nr:hypothetical protein [Portunus trituberculatus]
MRSTKESTVALQDKLRYSNPLRPLNHPSAAHSPPAARSATQGPYSETLASLTTTVFQGHRDD